MRSKQVSRFFLGAVLLALDFSAQAQTGGSAPTWQPTPTNLRARAQDFGFGRLDPTARWPDVPPENRGRTAPRSSAGDERIRRAYSNFQAGTYTGRLGNTYTLQGPTTIAQGINSWFLTCTDCDGKTSMTWTTGRPLSNPDLGSFPVDYLTLLPATYNYGIILADTKYSHDEFDRDKAPFLTGNLIAVRQIGDTIVIYPFNPGELVPGGAMEVLTLTAPAG